MTCHDNPELHIYSVFKALEFQGGSHEPVQQTIDQRFINMRSRKTEPREGELVGT